MRTGPPRLARALVSLLTPDLERRYVLGDLAEEYDVLVRTWGVARADAWYRRQVLGSLGPLVSRRWAALTRRLGERLRAAASDAVTDVRHGARVLRRSPLLTGGVVLTMSLAIAGVTAAFSVLDAVVLRPLPFASPDRLVRVVSARDDGRGVRVSLPRLWSWQETAGSFEALAGYATSAVTLSDGIHAPVRVRAAAVTRGFAELLGVQPVIGRLFEAGDHDPAGRRVAVLGHDFWRARYRGEVSVIGREVVVDGSPVTIVGVLPELGFAFPPDGGQLWVAVAPAAGSWQLSRRTEWLSVIGRLAPGRDMAAAARELGVRRRRGEASRAASERGTQGSQGSGEARPRYALRSVTEQTIGPVRPVLGVLGVAVACVLLLACGNTAMLLAARAQQRRSEFAMRSVLGGGSGRIGRQILVETLLLALLACGLGLWLAHLGTGALVALYPGGLPRGAMIGLGPRVVGVAVLSAFAMTVLFGVPPAFAAWRRESGRRLRLALAAAAAPRGRRVRSLLVVGQLAMSVAMLTGGALLVKRFVSLIRVDPGFQPSGVLTFHVEPSEERYRSDSALQRFLGRLVDAVGQVEGVQAAGTVSFLPFRGPVRSERVRAVDETDEARDQPDRTFATEPAPRRPADADSEVRTGGRAERDEPGRERRRSRRADVRAVRGDYFDVMGARLEAGRWFDAEDEARRRRVAILNVALAERLFGQAPAVGRRIRMDDRTWEVVGVVGNMRSRGLDEWPRGEVYVPGPRSEASEAVVVLRADLPPALLTGSLQDAVHALDPTLALADMATMEQRIRRSLAPQRFHATLLGGLSVLALLLAALGVYGLVAYVVAQRSKEIGIRKALGEDARTVLRRVLGWAAGLAAAGCLVGSAVAFAASSWFGEAIMDVDAQDATIFLEVPLLLLLVTVLAAWTPARRASRVDPMITMRA